MATKVYGIDGKTTVELTIEIGKAKLPLSFEHGCLDRKNYRPATFSTSDKCVQDMIEGSSYFGKKIRLFKVYGSLDEPAAPAPVKPKKEPVAAPAAEPEAEAIDFPEITSLEEAQAKLKSLGAKATQLSGTGMKKFMAAKNITFSNLVSE